MAILNSRISVRWARIARLPACALIALAGFVSARADDLPPALTLDLPVPVNLATPAWLGHPDTGTTTLPTLQLPIIPPDASGALLLTVYFTENQTGFLRVIWKTDQGSVVLADNLYEDVAMTNQRSLLIPPSTLRGPGTLILLSGAGELGVQRVKLEWLESRQDLVSPKTDPMLVTTDTGKTISAATINGLPPAPDNGAWDGDVVTVPLAATAVRVEQGVEFSVDLDKIPTTARVALQEAGLPLEQHLVVWVNEQRAGTLSPALPTLADSGFFTDSSSHTTYVGWRDGSFLIPPDLLHPGVNTIQLAVKAFSLQLNYQAPPTPDLPVLHLSAGAEPLPVDTSTPTTTPITP